MAICQTPLVVMPIMCALLLLCQPGDHGNIVFGVGMLFLLIQIFKMFCFSQFGFNLPHLLNFMDMSFNKLKIFLFTIIMHIYNEFQSFCYYWMIKRELKGYIGMVL